MDMLLTEINDNIIMLIGPVTK